MRQVIQDLQTGETRLQEVPCPQVGVGKVLIRTVASVVSSGTERSLVDFGKASMIGKARRQPEKVREVINKMRTDGLQPTLRAVRSKLGEPMPLGYCNAGIVIAVGVGVRDFAVGDRVASNGGHAEIVSVPQNLVVKIPEGVNLEHAAFTPLASIALQGLRLANPTIGERFVVSGLGVVGLFVVQLLIAQGCSVLGMDFDERRLALARQFGAEVVNLSEEDPLKVGHVFSRGYGVDGVIITASTTSNEPVHQAAQMSRKRGRIVLVGVTGLKLNRSDFYEKELTFQVSCSYGPGRYDPVYEGKGQDYPLGFVRWTERRNFEAVLELLKGARIQVEPLISHPTHFDNVVQAYEILSSDKTAIGIVLQYPCEGVSVSHERTVSILDSSRKPVVSVSSPTIGVLGAGAYTRQILLPALVSRGAQLHTIVSDRGLSSASLGQKFGFRFASTDPDALLSSKEVDAVIITTRHDSHARFVMDGLKQGKHVFVEKPLCLTMDEFSQIKDVGLSPGQVLMVGYNRRFSPHVKKMRSLLENRREPLVMVMTVNAGFIPPDHWTQDKQIGGGRLMGEACHFVDLLRFLADSKIVSIKITPLGVPSGQPRDTFTLNIEFADGSTGTVHYMSNGHRSFPKERLEIFVQGRILTLDNFRKLTAYGWPGFRRMRTSTQDKGAGSAMNAFIAAVQGQREVPIPIDEIHEVQEAVLRVNDEL